MGNEVKITTDLGFECTIDKTNMDDMRILDALVDLQNGDKTTQVIALRTILDRLLGPTQKEALYKYLEEKLGRASTGAVNEALLDIFNKIGETGKK